MSSTVSVSEENQGALEMGSKGQDRLIESSRSLTSERSECLALLEGKE